jgi:membrane-associated phospholipid phosphatase
VLQERLWVNYQQALANPETYNVLLYEGIAAFPSLHVAVVALFAIFLFHVNRWAGWTMTVYAAIIELGSVLLGWHFAVDGYAGIALVIVLYLIVRPSIVRKRSQNNADTIKSGG